MSLFLHHAKTACGPAKEGIAPTNQRNGEKKKGQPNEPRQRVKQSQTERHLDLDSGEDWLAKVFSMALKLQIEHRPNQWLNQWLAWRG